MNSLEEVEKLKSLPRHIGHKLWTVTAMGKEKGKLKGSLRHEQE